MNNRGFTLVELLATLIVLALVMSIGSYSIIQLMNNAKEKDYELLINNIKSSVETYYQECRYAQTSGINCPTALANSKYEIVLGDLVKYGFLPGNSTNADGSYELVNTKDSVSIMSCRIRYMYSDGKVIVEAVNPTGSCPTTY